MAGIGFRLQRLITGESYSDLVRAYFYSSVITSGPMIVVMAALAVINRVAMVRLSIEESRLFLSLLLYAYSFSMIVVSPMVYVVTRYLADKYYLKEIETFTPVYLSTLEILFAVQTLLSVFFLSHLQLSLEAKIALYLLYLSISAIWMAMIFLSAAQSYLWIVIAFLGGGIIGTLASYFWGRFQGFNGFLMGYTVGQFVTFFILTLRIFREFGYESTGDYGFILYFKRYPYLILIGLCYYLGIWIDKFIFWYSDQGEELIPLIHIAPNYDTPMFFAYLTVVPSLAFFVVQMETSFMGTYQDYYKTIRQRAGLDIITQKRNVIVRTLTKHFKKFALFQGIISGMVIALIYPITEALHINPYQLGTFRIAILGSFLLMGLVMIINILFYFEFQKEIFWITLIYIVTNSSLTYATLKWGSFASYGFGYTLAAFVSVVIGFYIMDHRLHHLNYYTFMNQPVLVPKYKFEEESKTVPPKWE